MKRVSYYTESGVRVERDDGDGIKGKIVTRIDMAEPHIEQHTTDLSLNGRERRIAWLLTLQWALLLVTFCMVHEEKMARGRAAVVC